MNQFNILRKQLDASQHCPICQASMYWVDAEQFDQELQFFQCSHCQHLLFTHPESNFSCHCKHCQNKRKRSLAETRQHEQRQLQRKFKKDLKQYELRELTLIQKLFLLSILDSKVNEHLQHDEYIDWQKIKYQPITPNAIFQHHLVKQLKQQHILLNDHLEDDERYYVNLRLDGYAQPSLFSLTQQLRDWFFHNLTRGTPFKNSNEVKDCLYLVLYEEIVQFMQFYCKTWQVQISGNRGFEQFCYRLLDQLAVGQIYYLIQNALDYLHKQKLLQARNDNFINTNFLKKTLEQYRQRATEQRWETTTLPRPVQLPLSQMTRIFIWQFLGYDESIFVQPVWRLWQKIEPRLKFYAEKRCMHCGSNDLTVDYDAQNYVTLSCCHCKHQDHYFTE